MLRNSAESRRKAQRTRLEVCRATFAPHRNVRKR